MKALNVLKSPIVEIGSDSDLNLQSNAVVLFATRAQIQEAISELEALQQHKSCEGCVDYRIDALGYGYCNELELNSDFLCSRNVKDKYSKRTNK